jgi:hypothetical protein
METPLRGKSRHVELSLDQLVDLQPGLGRLMPEVGRRYGILFYAARGGNWELAQYQWRQLRHLFRMGALLRPKMAKHLEAFDDGVMRSLEVALQSRDLAGFESAFEEGIRVANNFHRVTDHPEIRWRLPDRPPDDLDLTGGG